MTRLYELPTHLQVEDQLIAGLTVRPPVGAKSDIQLRIRSMNAPSRLSDDTGAATMPSFGSTRARVSKTTFELADRGHLEVTDRYPDHAR
jgi:hypothetical protein